MVRYCTFFRLTVNNSDEFNFDPRVCSDSVFFLPLPVCWCAGVPVCRCAGVLVCWCAGVLVCWCAGVLVFVSIVRELLTLPKSPIIHCVAIIELRCGGTVIATNIKVPLAYKGYCLHNVNYET